MNRRHFAHSWGRELFFGLGWPLLSLLGLIYFQANILPTDLLSLCYYLITNVSFFGLLTALTYFLLYSPVVFLFPSYYISRIWSLLLILALSSLVILDGSFFAIYRIHINPLIISSWIENGLEPLLNSKRQIYVMLSVLLVIAVGTWFKGERTWRVMQRRFSNPVKNWYLVMIVLGLGVSHLLFRAVKPVYFGNEVTLASIFPYNYQQFFYGVPHSQNKNAASFIKYPRNTLKCAGKFNGNIFIFHLNNLGHVAALQNLPTFNHLREHGTSFKNHFSTSQNTDEAFFSILYGLPAIYKPEILSGEVPPVLLTELQKRKYQNAVFSDVIFPGISHTNVLLKMGLADAWKDWQDQRLPNDRERPIFGLINIKTTDLVQMDLELKDILQDIHERDQLKGSVIIVTGSQNLDWENSPLIVVWPERKKAEVSHRTTHYDIAPTLQQKLFACKNKVADFSFGKYLTKSPIKDWAVFGNENSFKVMDFSQQKKNDLNWHGQTTASDKDSRKTMLKALKAISTFYRR